MSEILDTVMLAAGDLLVTIGLLPKVLLTAAVCAALGAIILSRFTQALGSASLPLNFVVLFAGAVVANVMMKPLPEPLDYSLERPFVVSLAGMSVAAIVRLLLLSRRRLSE
jgi:Na+/glutamate symporter